MLSEELSMKAFSITSQWDLVGDTPFVHLRNSGDGLVHVKHEGLNPGGSFFDRVARYQLSRNQSAKGLVVTGTTGHTVSLLTLANAQSIDIQVIVRPTDPKRLIELISKLASDLQFVDCAEECESRKQQLQSAGYVFCSRTDGEAHRRALAEIAIESHRALQGDQIDHWVLVDYGRSSDEVTKELRRALGYETQVHFVGDDYERERVLRDNAATRRVQIGHREGILVGPTGAELIDKAVSLAFTRGERVCAVIPDGGHRYLGWW